MATMTAKLSRKEERRLTSRWLMELAHAMQVERPNLTWRFCLMQAHLTGRLLAELGRGRVAFSYTKETDAVNWRRHAEGTLRRGVSKALDAWLDRPGSQPPTAASADTALTVTYWDLKREAWRSFKSWNLLTIDSHE